MDLSESLEAPDFFSSQKIEKNIEESPEEPSPFFFEEREIEGPPENQVQKKHGKYSGTSCIMRFYANLFAPNACRWRDKSLSEMRKKMRSLKITERPKKLTCLKDFDVFLKKQCEKEYFSQFHDYLQEFNNLLKQRYNNDLNFSVNRKEDYAVSFKK